MPGVNAGKVTFTLERLAVHEESLLQMRAGARPGTKWAAYRNEAWDSAFHGHFQFLAVGPLHTFKHAPAQFPDGACGPGWKYRHVGWVDLDTGEVIEIVDPHKLGVMP